MKRFINRANDINCHEGVMECRLLQAFFVMFLSQRLQLLQCLRDVLLRRELGGEDVAHDALFVDNVGDTSGQEAECGRYTVEFSGVALHVA